MATNKIEENKASIDLAGAYFQPVANGVRLRFKTSSNVEYVLLITNSSLGLFDANFKRVWSANITT